VTAYLNQQLVHWYKPIIPSYGRKLKIGGSWAKPIWAKSKTPMFKITRAKRAGGVSQTAEH
jgi:hypothetical protein